jgi:hypothetical protein
VFPASLIYSVDIETDTTVNGLDPRVARITELSLSTAAGDSVFNDADEVTLLSKADRALRTLPAGLITTWNGAFFDLPFIAWRARKHQMRRYGLTLIPAAGLTPKYDYLPGHDRAYTGTWAVNPALRGVVHQHLDISFAYKKVAADLGVKHSLKPVAKALGIDMIEVDREKMHELTPAERLAYAASDTRGTRELTIRLLGA